LLCCFNPTHLYIIRYPVIARVMPVCIECIPTLLSELHFNRGKLLCSQTPICHCPLKLKSQGNELHQNGFLHTCQLVMAHIFHSFLCASQEAAACFLRSISMLKLSPLVKQIPNTFRADFASLHLDFQFIHPSSDLMKKCALFQSSLIVLVSLKHASLLYSVH